MEEFEKLVAESFQAELTPAESTHVEAEAAGEVESSTSAETPSVASVPETEKAG